MRSSVDSESKGLTGLSPLTKHLLGIAVYYVVLVAAGDLFWRSFPQLHELFTPSHFRAAGKVGDLFTSAKEAIPGVSWETRRLNLALASAISILGALAVAVPVAWIYVLTRRRKGFTQSIVHTLLVLPLTVAGVVTLVQDSLALAFSLAGIVAAVRFRNTLEDSKDAVYIFCVTGIGIAAAVGDLVVGLVMSFLFNALALVLWYTEFGRAPANLEGSPAARALERARALADAGGEFVTSLDKEVLASMSPAQLEAVAAKAWRRRQLRDEGPLAERRFPFRAVLRVHASELEPVQLAVESVLMELAKRWDLSAVLPGEFGGTTLEYLVRLRKTSTREALVANLRARGGPQLVGVELR
ncbi:MAG TPA: DUF4956 domain-containing protein [Thermoanaerobaculia bacterium]|nr:DUF4956 domain-containing protein [Thermoanaerobaculia bacterium]